MCIRLNQDLYPYVPTLFCICNERIITEFSTENKWGDNKRPLALSGIIISKVIIVYIECADYKQSMSYVNIVTIYYYIRFLLLYTLGVKGGKYSHWQPGTFISQLGSSLKLIQFYI